MFLRKIAEMGFQTGNIFRKYNIKMGIVFLDIMSLNFLRRISLRKQI